MQAAYFVMFIYTYYVNYVDCSTAVAGFDEWHFSGQVFWSLAEIFSQIRERTFRICYKLVDYINDVILTGRLETKIPVVNTKWPWHLSILSQIPESPFNVHTCVCRELPKRLLLQTSKEDSFWLNRLPGKQWSEQIATKERLVLFSICFPFSRAKTKSWLRRHFVWFPGRRRWRNNTEL